MNKIFLLAILLILSSCTKPENSPTKEAILPAPATTENTKKQPADKPDSVAVLEQLATELKKNGRGNVIEVNFRGSKISDVNLTPLADLPELRSVLLNETAVSDEGLKLLGQLDSLKNLDLRGCAVSNNGLTHLVELENLVALRLSGQNNMTTVDDGGMVHLSGFTNLRVLAVDFLWVSEEGLSQLKKLANLEELYMAQITVGDDAMGLLGQFPKLKKLRISRNQISDTGLEMLGKNSQLEELDLSENSLVSDEGFRHLAGMDSLKRLNLWRVPISDVGLIHLAGMVRLEWLNLDNSLISDAGLVHLGKMKYLKITRTAVTEEGTRRLQEKLPNTVIQLKYIEGQ